MASRRPLVIVSGQFSELPAGDTVLGTSAGTLAAGSGLSGGGALTGSTVTLDVSLATNASGLIFVGDALGIDGVVQTVASAAQASGNAALIVGSTAQASGNAGISAALTAQASGNAALSTKYNQTGGVLSGTVIVNKQSFGTINTVTSSGVLLVDFSTGNNFTVTLDSSATFASPINASGGQCGAIAIRQDNTGSRTLAYSGSWAFQGGTAPTLTTAASGIDILSYYVLAPTRVIGILTAAYSGGSQ
jgi:hypothetical protein